MENTEPKVKLRMENTEPKVKFNISIHMTQKQLEILKQRADEDNRSVNNYIVNLILEDVQSR
jgi:phosphomannomutase